MTSTGALAPLPPLNGFGELTGLLALRLLHVLLVLGRLLVLLGLFLGLPGGGEEADKKTEGGISWGDTCNTKRHLFIQRNQIQGLQSHLPSSRSFCPSSCPFYPVE